MSYSIIGSYNGDEKQKFNIESENSNTTQIIEKGIPFLEENLDEDSLQRIKHFLEKKLPISAQTHLQFVNFLKSSRTF
jgi:hypothetical protein